MANLQVRAIYDFQAQAGTGEISLYEGELLTVVRKDVGEGWWEGTNEHGMTGLFPASYVEILEDQDAGPPDMPPPPLPPSYSNAGNSSDDWQAGWNVPNSAPFPSSDNILKPQTSTNVYNDADDWDDDWDDDDSETGTTYNGVANSTSLAQKKAVPSVSDVSTVGVSKIQVDERDKIYIVDHGHGIQWKPSSKDITCSISSPKKESKFHGMKSFIAYTITPSDTNQPVMRRYKHFDWLQERLNIKFPFIPIPPLPEKQISGRFEEDLIEYRMTMLQSWMDRMCRHPVLSQCEVFRHFITSPNDEKIWKAGKRKAESDKHVGANFYLTIERPDVPLELVHIESKIDGYSRFFNHMDDSVKLLQTTCVDQTKKYQTAFKREFTKISHSFSKLSRSFDMDPSNCSPELTDAIRHVSDAYSEIGTIYEEEPKHDWEPLNHLLYEYKGLLDGYPNVISGAKGAMSKRKQVEKDELEGKVDSEEVPVIRWKSDTIAYALQAEVFNFNQERQRDFKNAMTHFLTEQISFYQKITDRLRDALQKFNDV